MKELFTFILLVMFWFIFIFLINISIANADDKLDNKEILIIDEIIQDFFDIDRWQIGQPIVLGDNLQTALITITDNIEALAKIMHGYIKYQMKFNLK